MMSSPPPQHPLVRAMPVPGQHVVHDGRGGDGNDAEEEGIGRGTDHGVAEEGSSQTAVGEDEQGDIQRVVDQARQVEGQGSDAQKAQDAAPQQLAEAHHSAGNQPRGHHEQVDSDGIDARAQDGYAQPAASFMHS